MTVKSLIELAKMACIKKIKALDGVGDYLPYESVRPILQKVDSAAQLRQIELNSPQIQGETSELWIKLIEKDFPLEYKANAYKPQSPDKWYRVWEKYKKEHDTALEESEKQLKNALAGLKENKEKNTSKLVGRKFLPRAGRVGPKRGWGQRDSASSTLTFALSSHTKTNTGASVMRKVRREVKEIATIHGALSKSVHGPMRLSDVKKAPAAMVGDYQRAAQPQYRTSAQLAESASVVEQYEKRATFISDSEAEEDAEDVFDDQSHKTPLKPAPKPVARPVPPPAKHVSEAAKVSLLKKRPAAVRAPPAVKAATKASPSAPATQKHESARASSQFKSSAAEADSSCLPISRTTPTHDTPAGSLSPEEMMAAAAESPAPAAQPRKRKGVDIFMRPKKRKT